MAADLVALTARRYPGPRPFSDDVTGHRTFRGREKQVNALFDGLKSAGFLVLTGESGTGKSSLLNARLFPRLREAGFLPIPLKGFPDDSSLFSRLSDELPTVCQQQEVDYEEGIGTHLWEFFKTTGIYQKRKALVPVLVLDQFEELFTLQRNRPEFRQQVVAELAELVSPLFPKRLREQLLDLDNSPFSESPPKVKVLLSMRQDYVGYLTEMRGIFPGVLDNTYCLEGLSEDDARQAIVEPARLPREEVPFASPEFEFPPRIVDKILSSARKDSNPTIEPFILQVFCHNVEGQVIRAAEKNPGQPVDADQVVVAEDFDRALSGYYETEVQKAAREGNVREAIVREWFRKRLIDPTGRIRTPFVATTDPQTSDLAGETGMTFKALATLERGFLVRREQHGRATHFELVHDRLVAPLVKCNADWLESSPELVGRGHRWQARHNPVDLVRGEALRLFNERFRSGTAQITDLEQQLLQSSNEEAQREQARVIEQENQRLKLRWMRGVVVASMIALAGVFWGLLTAWTAEKTANSERNDAVEAREKADTAKDTSDEILYTLSLFRAMDNWRERAPKAAWKALRVAQGIHSKRSWVSALVEQDFLGDWRRWPEYDTEEQLGWQRITQVACQPRGLLIAVAVVAAPIGGSSKAVVGDTTLFVFDPSKPLSKLNPTNPRPLRFFANVGCIAWLDEQTLISGSYDGRVRLWNTNTGGQIADERVINSVEGTAVEETIVSCLCAIPGQRKFVTGDSMGSVVRWTWETGVLTPHFIGSHAEAKTQDGFIDNTVTALAVHPEGQLVVSAGSDRWVKVWKLNETTDEAFLKDHSLREPDVAITALAFSKDGKLLASGNQAGRVRYWIFDNFDPEVVSRGIADHHGKVCSLVWVGSAPMGRAAETGRWLSGGEDGAVRLSDGEQSRMLFGGASDQLSISLSDPIGGKQYIVGTDDDTLARGKLVISSAVGDEPTAPPIEYYSAAMSHDGRLIVRGGHRSAASDADRRGVIELVSAVTGQPLDQQEMNSPVWGIALGGPGERIVASCARDGKIQIWDREENSLKRRKTFDLRQPKNRAHDRGRQEVLGEAIAIHPTGKWLLCASNNGKIERWDDLDSPTLRSPPWLPLPADPKFHGRVKENPNFRYGFDFSVDTKGEYQVLSMEFNQAGNELLTGDSYGRILLWPVTDAGLGLPIWVGSYDSSKAYSASYSHDSERILSGSENGHVRVWRIPTKDVPSADPNEPIFGSKIPRPFKDPLWEIQLPGGSAIHRVVAGMATSRDDQTKVVTLSCFLGDGMIEKYYSTPFESKPSSNP